MNKKLKIALGCILVILVCGFVACQVIIRNANEVNILPIKFSSVKDGSYTGTHRITPVSVKLKVEVKDHRMTSITLLEHIQGLGTPAEALLANIVDKQSLTIDVVSGATVSSKCILKATENALLKGK